MGNNNALTLSTANFMDRLATSDVTKLGKGLVLYSSEKSLYFCPLVINRKEGEILVTQQDNIPEDKLVALFGEDAVAPEGQYVFPEKELDELLEDEPEFLSDIVSILEKNRGIKPESFLGLLTELKAEGFGLTHVLATLDGLASDEVARLMIVYENGLLKRSYFAELVCKAISTDDDEFVES